MTQGADRRRLRIAVARINQETHALSPVHTTLADFERTHLLEGEQLRQAMQPGAWEVQDLFRNVELSGFARAIRREGRDEVEVVPLFSAWASPSGPLTPACFSALRERLRSGLLAAGPLDALYLSLHGAMGTVGDTDPEGALLRLAREVLGPGVPIAVTYDLHGNLTAQKVAHADIALAYKTNPHRDHARIGAQAARILLRTLRGEVRPVQAWRSLPMILGGGMTVDFLPPVRSLFARLHQLERDPRVLAASLLMCHPWNADPELGWAVHVVTDGDEALAESLVESLAERAWAVRHELPPRFAEPLEAIEIARAARLRRKVGVVTLADASDVVTAGSTGENTRLIEALIQHAQGLVCHVPIRDPIAIDALWQQRPGERVHITLGGRLDPARNPPLEVEGTLAHLTRAHGVDRMAVVDVGSVRIVVVEGPAIVLKPSFFRNAGLNPWQADIVVVKNFFPFRLFFLPLSRKTLYVRTGGLTDLDAALALPFAGPVHPKDDVTDWREADRRRRALV